MQADVRRHLVGLEELHVSATDVQQAVVPDGLQLSQDFLNPLAPALLADLAERRLAEVILIGAIPFERVMAKFKVGHEMTLNKERRAESGAESEHYLDSLAFDVTEALDVGIIGGSGGSARYLGERVGERETLPARVQVGRRPDHAADDDSDKDKDGDKDKEDAEMADGADGKDKAGEDDEKEEDEIPEAPPIPEAPKIDEDVIALPDDDDDFGDIKIVTDYERARVKEREVSEPLLHLKKRGKFSFAFTVESILRCCGFFTKSN